MNRFLTAAVAALLCLSLITEPAIAKGSFSSSGRGSFSSSRSSPRSSSGPTYRSAPRTTTTTTTHTTINRSYSGYGGYGYHPMMMYPGFGMGYGYSNGLVEGLIIGNLMHPSGTTIYSGGGYSGNALLYPDGRVVDQNGYQVGTYNNGQFMAVQGGMVAQQAPVAVSPVVVHERDAWDLISDVLLWIVIIVLIASGLIFLFGFIGWLLDICASSGTETVVHTMTTTTTQTDDDQEPVGTLKRHKQGRQFYVIDPADKSKTWVNDGDDIYEDADGEIWRLI